MLTDEQIKQFQMLWKNSFGEEITEEKALEFGTKLVDLMRLIYKPITKEEFNKYEIHKKEV